jgi:hypothetical protein
MLRAGEMSEWPERQLGRWIGSFIALGIVLRVVRLALKHPLWRDEAYLAANLWERDFSGLMSPLDYQQVCPLFFLWAEKAVIGLLGFGEWSLRLIPTAAAIASLFLLSHVARRLLTGPAPAFAVAILAVAYTPIRHGGEIKPYATDFLVALALLALAVEWLSAPGRVGFLWGLVMLGPLAVGVSNPAIFVAASVGLVLAIPVLRTRSARAIVPLTIYGMTTTATFAVLFALVNSAQSDSVAAWMRIYWAGAFPPRSFTGLLAWLVKVHTSQMFAYPAGGDRGASILTTGLVLVAAMAYVRRGPRVILALLLCPFALGLTAAFFRLYPYGGSARIMQYVAPSIILMASLGAAILVGRLRRPSLRVWASRAIFIGLFAIGLGMLAWDVSHPFYTLSDEASRDFARRFWAEESSGAELVCARTDLHLSLNPLVWRGDRAATYLCHQAIYSGRHRAKDRPRLDRVSESHPLRVVVFGSAASDRSVMSRWIAENADRYRLRSRRERVLNEGLMRGKAVAEERYTLYEFVPALP